MIENYSKLNLDTNVKNSLKKLSSFRDMHPENVLFDIKFSKYDNSDIKFILYLSIRNYSNDPLPNELFFGDISELSIYDRSSNNRFYDSIFSNKNLIRLNLALYNNFSVIPDNFHILSRLTELSIQIPNLDSFPSSVCRLKHLISLTLICSNIIKLPELIFELNSKLLSLTIGSVKESNMDDIKNETKRLQIPEIILLGQ
ncbi:MAG: hypothetical protein HeimC3_45710 [Candidatus Heimdallarchaeota archaeon LC_3]|nr:MAG: hypothetical protein HeimC3_45710 [Candidatus Heimdallarchaeota archaeon LC_3]